MIQLVHIGVDAVGFWDDGDAGGSAVFEEARLEFRNVLDVSLIDG